MTFQLPNLPYASDSLSPFLSSETLGLHHGKHHNAYVVKGNELLADAGTSADGLIDLVKNTDGGLFNNAGQHLNHSIYWRSIAPGEGRAPGAKLLEAIERDFGSLNELRDAFSNQAATFFGSGWCWLTRDGAGKLAIRTTGNAHCPVEQGETPLLTCDVWEHAYYVDYRNVRPDYVAAFWKAIDWSFADGVYDNPDSLEGTVLA